MGIISTLLLIGGGTWIYAASNSDKEEAMKYDYLTRMKQWNQIIKAAENKEPNSPFSVTCLNLALAKTGQLGIAHVPFLPKWNGRIDPHLPKRFHLTAPYQRDILSSGNDQLLTTLYVRSDGGYPRL